MIAGFANVTKLKGATSLGPALTRLDIATFISICPTYFLVGGTVFVDFHGQPQFPPVHSTFLTFGFVPVSATLRISQVGAGQLAAISPAGTTGNLVIVRMRLAVRVLSATVNGVPLAVGPACQTSRPVSSVLAGFDPTSNPGPGYYTIIFGGTITGTITFPSFSGCGVGDNLNPILTASISGAQNFVKVTQGRICSLVAPIAPQSVCPPQVPVPVR